MAGLLLIALALLAVSAPAAAAEAPPRPRPTPLWQQFPLDPQPSAPAGAESAPASSARVPSVGSNTDEGAGRSLSTVQIAAIVLAIAVVLMLTTAGLSYAAYGPFAAAAKRRLRPRALPEFVGAFRPGPAVGRPVRTMTHAARRATQTVDARVHAVRAAAAGLYGRIAPQAGEATLSDEGGFLKRLDAHLHRANGKRRPARESEDTVPPPSAIPDRSLADDELEVLKAKLGKRVVPAEERPDDVETLKAKLESATKEVASLKAKLENNAEPATNSSAASLDVEMREVDMDRQGVNPASPASPRSTAPRLRQGATLRAAAVSLERPMPIKCRITWWRGYVNSVFYAIARTAAGDEQVIAESPHFRWHKAEPPPQNAKALEAHRSLLELLERDGWSVAGTGDDWFAHELERRQAHDLLR